MNKIQSIVLLLFVQKIIARQALLRVVVFLLPGYRVFLLSHQRVPQIVLLVVLVDT